MVRKTADCRAVKVPKAVTPDSIVGVGHGDGEGERGGLLGRFSGLYEVFRSHWSTEPLNAVWVAPAGGKDCTFLQGDVCEAIPDKQVRDDTNYRYNPTIYGIVS